MRSNGSSFQATRRGTVLAVSSQLDRTRIGARQARRHSGACEARTRNLEIPRCAIAHLRSGPEPVIGRRKAPTRWDHPGMTVSGLHVIATRWLAMTALQLKRPGCLKIESNN